MNNVNNSDTQQQHQQQQQYVNGISNGSHVHSIIQSDIITTATDTKSSNTPYKNGITNHTNGSSDHCNGVDRNGIGNIVLCRNRNALYPYSRVQQSLYVNLSLRKIQEMKFF
jgi:hypothetical protein